MSWVLKASDSEERFGKSILVHFYTSHPVVLTLFYRFTLKIWNFLAMTHKWIFLCCGCWQLISPATFDKQCDNHREWVTGFIVSEHSLCLWWERTLTRATEMDCCDSVLQVPWWVHICTHGVSFFHLLLLLPLDWCFFFFAVRFQFFCLDG